MNILSASTSVLKRSVISAQRLRMTRTTLSLFFVTAFVGAPGLVRAQVVSPPRNMADAPIAYIISSTPKAGDVIAENEFAVTTYQCKLSAFPLQKGAPSMTVY